MPNNLKLVDEFLIPRCSGKGFIVKKGQVMRVIESGGGQVADIKFLNADNYEDRFSAIGSMMLNGFAGVEPVEPRINNQIQAGDLVGREGVHFLPQGSVEEYLADIPPELRDDWPEPFRLSSGSTRALLRRGAKEFGWRERWNGWGKPYKSDGPRRRGVGVGIGAHTCGVEFEGATLALVRINRDGGAKVFCSVGRQGQGSATTQAQVAAEALGFPLEPLYRPYSKRFTTPQEYGWTF